jgi:hypothetical protein
MNGTVMLIPDKLARIYHLQGHGLSDQSKGQPGGELLPRPGDRASENYQPQRDRDWKAVSATQISLGVSKA